MWRNADFLSEYVKLYIQGKPRYQTIFGGIMSSIAVLLIVSFSFFFALKLLSRKNMNVVFGKNLQQGEALNLSQIPFMLKISSVIGENFLPNVTYPIYQYWEILPENNGVPVIYNLTYEMCDINKHFGIYQGYFENFPDLNLNYCINKINHTNITLYGIEGDRTVRASKLLIFMTKCVNDSVWNPHPGKCASQEEIDRKFSGNPPFLYITILDNNIQFENLKQPFQPYVTTKQLLGSPAAMYRYYMKWKIVHLMSDLGFVFEDRSLLSGYQYSQTTTDLFIGSTFSIKESYALVALNMEGQIDVYNRSYDKFQSFLASIGGIINFFILFSRILVNYFTFQNMFLDLANEHIDFKNTGIKSTPHSITNYFPKNSFKSNSSLISRQGNLPQYNNFTAIKNSKSTLDLKYLNNNIRIAKDNKIKLSFVDFFIPKHLRKKNIRNILHFIKAVFILKSKLSLENILKISRELETIKVAIFNKIEVDIMKFKIIEKK
jgi:hypothetical protein